MFVYGQTNTMPVVTERVYELEPSLPIEAKSQPDLSAGTE